MMATEIITAPCGQEIVIYTRPDGTRLYEGGHFKWEPALTHRAILCQLIHEDDMRRYADQQKGGK